MTSLRTPNLGNAASTAVVAGDMLAYGGPHSFTLLTTTRSVPMKHFLLAFVCVFLTSTDSPRCAALGDDALRAKPATDSPPVESKNAFPAPVTPDSKSLREIERQYFEALETRIDRDLEKDTPLKEAISVLAKACGLPFWIDHTALSEEGISPDEPVYTRIKGRSVIQALDRILDPLGMTWYIDDELVKITTDIAESEVLSTRIYDPRRFDALLKPPEVPVVDSVDDPSTWKLVQVDAAAPAPTTNLSRGARPDSPADRLLKTSELCTNGPWEDVDGVGGSLRVYQNLLIIRQTFTVHQEVEGVLNSLEIFAAGKLNRGSMEVLRPGYPSAADAEIRRKLEQRADFDIKDVPLNKALQNLEKRIGVVFDIEENALAEEGVSESEPVSLSAKNISYRAALETMLEAIDLEMIVYEGRILVTTMIVAEEKLYTVLYDVRDLPRTARYEAEPLINLLIMETTGPWEVGDGAGGRIDLPFDGLLLCRQTAKVHSEIVALLAALRANLGTNEDQPAADAKPTPARDPHAVETRIYPVAQEFFEEDVKERAKELESALEALVEPKSWVAAGGEGVIRIVGSKLIIRQNVSVHGKIESFLKRLRTAEDLQLQAPGGSSSVNSGAFGGGSGPF